MRAENAALKARIDHLRHLCGGGQGTAELFEAATLAQTVLHDTVGDSHPLMATLKDALQKPNLALALAVSRGVVKLFEEDLFSIRMCFRTWNGRRRIEMFKVVPLSFETARIAKKTR